jgi:hypothetical protein
MWNLYNAGMRQKVTKFCSVHLTERATRGVILIAYVTVVRRRNNILKLLSSENVNSNKVALGMAMLPSLGSGDLNNLTKQIPKLLSDQGLLDQT